MRGQTTEARAAREFRRAARVRRSAAPPRSRAASPFGAGAACAKHRPILLTGLPLGLVSVAPAGATDTVLATGLEPSAGRTYAGTEVYSAVSVNDGAPTI